MKFTAVTFACLGLLTQSAMANWSLDFFTSGCPTDGASGDAGITAGQPDDELWCISVNSAHNVVANNIVGDNMEGWLFSSKNCNEEGALITHITEDGCQVIPSDTVIEAVRILPKA